VNRPPAAAAGPPELQELRGFLRTAKGDLAFARLTERAEEAGHPVSERTLRRALDGRLPSRATVIAFALARAKAEGDDRVQAARRASAAELRWEKAAAACRPPAPTARQTPRYVPGPITTRAGLARAMRRLREAAGHPSLRSLCNAPQARGRIARSTLQLVLAGRRMPSAGLLEAVADVCGAGPQATTALLAALDRILNGPLTRPRPLSVCDLVEEAEDRRRRDAAALHWRVQPERDWYDQQLHDESEAGRAAMTAWVDDLDEDHLEALQQPADPADRRDLRAGPADRAARIRPAPWRPEHPASEALRSRITSVARRRQGPPREGSPGWHRGGRGAVRHRLQLSTPEVCRARSLSSVSVTQAIWPMSRSVIWACTWPGGHTTVVSRTVTSGSRAAVSCSSSVSSTARTGTSSSRASAASSRI
jgi:hypothetical protein